VYSDVQGYERPGALQERFLRASSPAALSSATWVWHTGGFMSRKLGLRTHDVAALAATGRFSPMA
jgi:hypothetical protein